eukprot:s1597_g5.t1
MATEATRKKVQDCPRNVQELCLESKAEVTMGSFGDEAEPSLTQVLEQMMEEEGVLETQLDDEAGCLEKRPSGTFAESEKCKVEEPLDAPEQGETLSSVQEMSMKVDAPDWVASGSKAHLASAFCTPEKKDEMHCPGMLGPKPEAEIENAFRTPEKKCDRIEPVSSAKTGQKRSISDEMHCPGMLGPKPEAEIENAFRTPEKKCDRSEPVSSAKTVPQERSISDEMQRPGMLGPKPEDSESALCQKKCDHPFPPVSSNTGPQKRSLSDPKREELSSLPWELLWPRLEAQGWRIDFGPRGTGRQVYYLPPGVFRGPGSKNRIHYFDSKKLVMQLIQQSPDKQRKLAET